MNIRWPKIAVCTGWLCFFVVAGCNTAPAGEVKPGDRDYPEPNPSPTQFITIKGRISPTLDLKFGAHWRVTSGGSKDRPCGWVNDWLNGHSSFFSIFEELVVGREGDRYEIKVPIDGFLPGHCGWRLEGIWARFAVPGAPWGAQLVSAMSGALVLQGAHELKCSILTKEQSGRDNRLTCYADASWPRGAVPALEYPGQTLEINFEPRPKKSLAPAQ
jgi:hypothetical protein